MRRTLSLRIYTVGDYGTSLKPDIEGLCNVRLSYAIAAGSNFARGAVVPGGEFEHQDEGVWERSVNTSIMDPYRTDYYYVQYTEDGGVTWVDVAGYDPFYFNTRISGAGAGGELTQPTIADYVPTDPVISHTSSVVQIATDGLYDTPSNVAVNPSYIRCMEYKFTSDTSTPGDGDWLGCSTLNNTLILQRIGAEAYNGEYLHARYRIYNPVSGEYSEYSNPEYQELTSASLEEMIDGTIPTPKVLTAGDVTEVNIWGTKDGFRVNMPIIPRGMHSELAVQYGSEANPTIVDGELGSAFNGIIIRTTDTAVVVSKPMTLSTSVDSNIYLARRVVAYDDASPWVGVSLESMLEVNIAPPSRLSMISNDILDTIVDYVAPKLETSTGLSLSKKT